MSNVVKMETARTTVVEASVQCSSKKKQKGNSKKINNLRTH